MRVSLLLLCWLWFGVAPALGAADAWIGQPSLSRYTPAETGAQPYSFSVLPLPSGEIFIGNSEGLLRYFGRQFELIRLPGGSAARSLALGRDGRVYVGGYQHFGVLQRGEDGRYQFLSLERDFFPDSVGAPLGEIWDVIATPEGVYFGTRLQIFHVAYDGSRRTIELPSPLQSLYALDDELVVALRDRQLLRWRQGELHPWVRLPARTRGLLADGPVGPLALTSAGQLLRVHADRVEPLSHPMQSLFRAHEPYTMVRLPAGDLAIGTLGGDLLRVSADLQHYRVWPLGPAPVIGLGVDRENHLWAATETDIVRVSLSTAWSMIDRSSGLGGPVTQAAEYAGTLYVATSVGLYRAHPADAGKLQFELVALAQEEVNSIASTAVGLLIGARTGVYVWREERLQAVVPDLLIWRLVPSRVVPGRYYAVEDAGLLVLDQTDVAYTLTQHFSDPSYRFDELAEAADGSLWVDRLLADPMRFDFEASTRRLAPPGAVALGPARGQDGNAAVLQIDGHPMVSTESQLLIWQDGRFVPLQTHPLIEARMAPAATLRVRTCADGSLYAFDSRRVLRRAAAADSPWQELHPMDGGARGVIDVQCQEAAGPVWLGTWNGMVRFDPGAPRGELKAEAPVMERVRLYPASGEPLWLPLQADGAEFPEFRRLRFDYASPQLSGSVRYQSRLRGYDAGWVDSGADGSREFAALPAGSYMLEARVLDDSGAPGPALRYAFRVPRAWYQTLPGVLALAALLGALIALLIAWRSHTLRRRNAELEALVAERTEALGQRSLELELANRRLSELADLDGLTGVANRRKLEHELDDAYRLAQQSSGHLALLLIDVDHFKQFNDTYGHLLGDERLKAISERLAGWVGPDELLARYGGEEFVLLMPGSSVDVARERAEAIRRDARHVGRDGERSTISIGISELRAHKASNPTQLFEYADLALYRAKHSGRDRVEVY